MRSILKNIVSSASIPSLSDSCHSEGAAHFAASPHDSPDKVESSIQATLHRPENLHPNRKRTYSEAQIQYEHPASSQIPLSHLSFGPPHSAPYKSPYNQPQSINPLSPISQSQALHTQVVLPATATTLAPPSSSNSSYHHYQSPSYASQSSYPLQSNTSVNPQDLSLNHNPI
ncbi:hypothetical protein DID88_005152 [Monilinia fructigena]|uniref:Uncharacterized protein n=1 Tax=Monilinia fructigena TaxID=38457 RepID=A0A395IGD1_9HELO|nr:hypothetical protein DID88_005152 [Monilinia fructigena]